MDYKTAAILLASLTERIDREQTIGIVSSLERQALQLARQALEGEAQGIIPAVSAKPAQMDTVSAPPVPDEPMAVGTATSKSPPLPKVTLVLDSINNGMQCDCEALMCLDFGTAMSKAFASLLPDEFLELELGAAAGRSGYTLPSSVFIADDGKAYFGFEAIDLSQELIGSGRERLDSIKGWLSLRREGNLDGEAFLYLQTMGKAVNQSCEF